MKRRFEVRLSCDGNPNHSPITICVVEAENEYEAVRKAEQSHPREKVCSVKEK